MKHKQVLTGIAASLGMLILILDGKTALEGARDGIELCMRTVIPSLFPFFILSIMLTSAFTGTDLLFLRPIGRLCGVPQGAESLLISGFLGGYPVGAQCVCAAFNAGQIQKRDAERMLAFCNNAGPAFLFGMVASMFPSRRFAWALWGIHIVSALGVSLVLSVGDSSDAKMSCTSKKSLPSALNAAIRVMAAVCGWVVLFRVILAFLDQWVFWALTPEIRILLTGLLELSNGCCELGSVADPSVRFPICSVMLAFGGLCVTLQTVSVTRGLSLRSYFRGKLLQTALSLLICLGVVCHIWLPALLALIFLLGKMQKRSSIRAAVRV